MSNRCAASLVGRTRRRTMPAGTPAWSRGGSAAAVRDPNAGRGGHERIRYPGWTCNADDCERLRPGGRVQLFDLDGVAQSLQIRASMLPLSVIIVPRCFWRSARVVVPQRQASIRLAALCVQDMFVRAPKPRWRAARSVRALRLSFWELLWRRSLRRARFVSEPGRSDGGSPMILASPASRHRAFIDLPA